MYTKVRGTEGCAQKKVAERDPLECLFLFGVHSLLGWPTGRATAIAAAPPYFKGVMLTE